MLARPDPGRFTPGSRISPYVSAWVLAIGAAVLAFAGGTRDFVTQADGWSYWEASVSLLEGHGYRYFGGHPVGAWPPLFALWLAAGQWILGVSARSLFFIQWATACAGAWFWMRTWPWLSPNATAPSALPGALHATSTVLMLGQMIDGPASECLGYALLGAVFWWNLRPLRVAPDLASAPVPRLPATAVQGLVSAALIAAMLLAKNSCLAAVPVVAGMAWLAADERRVRWPFLAAVAPATLAVAAWWSVRAWLGQAGSHALDRTTSKHSLAENTLEYLRGLGAAYSTYRPGLALATGGAVVALLALGAWATRRDAGIQPRLARALLLGAAGYGLVLGTIMSLTWIDNTAGERRFVIPGQFLLLGALAWAASSARALRLRAVALGLLTLAAASAVNELRQVNCGTPIPPGATVPTHPPFGWAVPWNATLRSDWYSRGTTNDGTRLLLSPPDYSWTRRPRPRRGVRPAR